MYYDLSIFLSAFYYLLCSLMFYCQYHDLLLDISEDQFDSLAEKFEWEIDGDLALLVPKEPIEVEDPVVPEGNGSDASVVFGKQQIIIHGWIKVQITSKVAVLILKVRKQINQYLLKKVADPKEDDDIELSNILTRLLSCI